MPRRLPAYYNHGSWLGSSTASYKAVVTKKGRRRAVAYVPITSSNQLFFLDFHFHFFLLIGIVTMDAMERIFFERVVHEALT